MIVEQAHAAALGAEGVHAVSRIRARWTGHRMHADVLLTAHGDLTLSQAHAVAERARHAMLHTVPRLASVIVHVDPQSHDDQDHHADLAHRDQPAAESRVPRR